MESTFNLLVDFKAAKCFKLAFAAKSAEQQG
jgi:hypothetical protein